MSRSVSPATRWVLLTMLLGYIVFVSTEFAFPALTNKNYLTDFDIFHLVGRLTLAGDFATAYDPERFQVAQSTLPSYYPGQRMYWSYPPVSHFLLAPLGALNVGVAFFLFAILSAALYLWVLIRLAGREAELVVMATAPMLALVLRCGQNGFLTAGILGLSLLALRAGRPIRGGAALGLLAVKPHLAVGFGLTLLSRRGWWGAAAMSLMVVAALVALSIVAFGVDAWTEFFAGTAATRALLDDPSFISFRMVSLYCALYGAGVAKSWALAIHLLVAFGFIAIAWRASLRQSDMRVTLGLATYATATFSPYAYDYDMTFLGLALALVLPVLRETATPQMRRLLLGLYLAIGSYGLLCYLGIALSLRDGNETPWIPPVVGGYLTLAFGVALVAALARRPDATAAPRPGAGPLPSRVSLG